MALDLGLHLGLGAGGSSFSPLSLSPYLWWDFTDAATMFQSGSRASPGTASGAGDPVGLVLDKSGTNADFTQGTAAAKPTRQSGYISFDGGDGLATANSFSAPADSDVFIALYNNSNDTAFLLFWPPSNIGQYLGVAQSGNAGANNAGIGTPANLVNGTAVSPDTRDGLYTAVGSSAVKVFECRNAALNWTDFGLGNYAGFELTGRIMEALLFPALSAANRTLVRDYLTTRHGAA